MFKVSFSFFKRTVLVFMMIAGSLFFLKNLQHWWLEKQALWNDQIIHLQSQLDKFQLKNDSLLQTHNKQLQNLDQKLSSLALSIKTGSTDSDESQELLKLILSNHHDLDIVIQAIIALQIFNNDSGEGLEWVQQLDRLSPQDKLNFQRLLTNRPTWQKALSMIYAMRDKDSPRMFFGVLEKFGIRVERSASAEYSVLNDIAQSIEKQEYFTACEKIVDLPQGSELTNYLEDLCFVEPVIRNYWKNLENKN